VKVTYKWLQEFVDISWSPKELADRLTMTGSEVEAIELVPPILKDVYVGRIKKVAPHPTDNRLLVCVLDLGKKDINVVCGALNVRKGLLVPVALPGSILPNGKEIKISKIHSVLSEGMICSEFELGLSETADIIMELPSCYKPGSLFDPADSCDDVVLDVFINPNRPDCMSVIGLARELSALSGNPLKTKPVTLPRAKLLPNSDFTVEIKDTIKCPRYSGAIMTGITVKPSPIRIQQRLYAAGIRPINNIVDATNYILVEWGHPIHAFDLDVLQGKKIVVKTAQRNETFTTLDNETRLLNNDVLMICDGKCPVAIGGIMGGSNSEIQQTTLNIFIECAYFQPENIQKSSRYLGLSTEASRRFERGMDPNFCMEALKRVCALVLEISPGTLHKPFFDVYPKRIMPKRVPLRIKRLNNILGTNYTRKRIEQSLNCLELDTISADKDEFIFKVPTFRHDLTREIDLIEEVARVIGLEEIEPKQTATIQLRNIENPDFRTLGKIREIMVELGFLEIYNYSMIDIRLEGKLLDKGIPISLKNPISPELGYLRPSLLPGLLNTVLHNINRGAKNLRLFELGKVYAENIEGRKGVSEIYHLGGAIYGKQNITSWDEGNGKPVDIFTIKGIIESFFKKISLDIIENISYDIPYIDQVCSLYCGKKNIGIFGKYRNNSLNIECNEPIFIFEIDSEEIIKHLQKVIQYKPYSRFPAAKRDMAFVIPDAIPVQDVVQEIEEIGKPLLQSLTIEEVYKGKPVPNDCRSVLLSLKFFSYERSLLDDEVDAVIQTIIEMMKKEHNINIRQ